MRQSLSDGSLVSNYFTCLFSFMWFI
jgi:hypothetical protein